METIDGFILVSLCGALFGGFAFGVLATLSLAGYIAVRSKKTEKTDGEK